VWREPSPLTRQSALDEPFGALDRYPRSIQREFLSLQAAPKQNSSFRYARPARGLEGSVRALRDGRRTVGHSSAPAGFPALADLIAAAYVQASEKD